MDKGTVYLFYRDVVPVECKVGLTIRQTWWDRLRRLNRTGLLAPWKHWCDMPFENARWAEKMTLEAFSHFRPNENTEIFLLDPKAVEPYLRLLQRCERHLAPRAVVSPSDTPPLEGSAPKQSEGEKDPLVLTGGVKESDPFL